MYKKRIMALTFVFIFMCVAPALASEVSPFSDVPRGIWAYDAVQKLAKDGIVTGYGDGTFQGNRVMTRYEMAEIVANALTKIDQANAEQKAIIQKLADEYATELKMLDVRVSKLEKKVDVTVSGSLRERYEWVNNTDSSAFTRLQLNLKAPLNDSLTFYGRIESEGAWGVGPRNGLVPSDPAMLIDGQVTNISQAFVIGKAFGIDQFIMGRFPLLLGQGILADTEATGTPLAGADGIVLGGGSDKLKYLVVGGKLGLSNLFANNPANGYHATTLNARGFNVVWQSSKNLAITLDGLQDNESAVYRTIAAGFSYKGISDLTLQSEYAKNGSDLAKSLNNGSDAKAWFAKIKYLGADPSQTKSYGLWVAYRSADPGYDPWSIGSAGGDDVPLLLKAPNYTAHAVSSLSNVKGFDYGYELTVFKNGVLSLQYSDLESKENNIDAKNFLATVTYFF